MKKETFTKLCDKFLDILGQQKTFFIVIKATYYKSATNIILNGENL